MHDAAAQLAWHKPILSCHMALDSLFNADFFIVYRECQRPVAFQLQLLGQTFILEF